MFFKQFLRDDLGCASYLIGDTDAGECVVDYPHRPLKDGDTLEVGNVRLKVLHTPGHRPEHIALAVTDSSRAQEPWLVLTGDALFVGDVGRPDLAVEPE